MRPAPGSLIAFLLSKQPYWTADLFTFTLRDGTVNRWTSSDTSLVVGANTFLAIGPALTRSSWSIKNTMEVPDMDIQMLSNGTDYDGANIKLLIHNGLLDGASIQLDRAFMPVYGDTSIGTVTLFGGRASQITINALGALIKVKGENVILQQYMPRNRYMLSCIHTLYDTGCTLDRTDFTFSGVVGAGSTASFINWGTPRSGDGIRFLSGYVTFTSGDAEGETRSVQGANDSSLDLAYPLYNLPSPGDTFNATYGCLRSTTACGQFSNLQHYRGFPLIPPVETAY